jgi:hypothetical protein
VSLDELALGEVRRGLLRAKWARLWADGQFVTEDDLAEPSAAQDGAVARSSGLFGERGGEAEDAAAALSVEAVDALPFAFRNRSHSASRVVLRIHEGVIRIEQAEDAAVVLDEVDEEAGDFFLHVVAEVEEGGEVALALFVERGDIADVEVLAAELEGETAHFVALEHALGLSGDVIELGGAQFIIGCGGPQEVAEACREFLRAHGAGFVGRFLATIQKRGRSEHAHEHQTRRERLSAR